ncbi:MAG: DUF1553 domain-containing protein [Candidatus Hydrogenedentota bacterium]
MKRFSGILVIGALVAACLPSLATEPISFNRDIKPILSNNCFDCHGPDARARKRRPRFDTFEGVTSLTRFKKHPVVPGKPHKSEMIKRVSSDDTAYRMPPEETGKRLTPEQIELLSRWIEEGGEYSAHWSYIAPERPPLPSVLDEKWPWNPVDYFVMARLDEEQLHPSEEADRHTLIRRLSLDLTGLPPTPEQVKKFVKSRKKKSYEKLVDELLESPAYGEYWTQLWLDLARYADSKGYEKDATRTIWKYRDWVIDALNADMPYTQFTVEQLAGDLLENPTESQIIATAFHRNTMNNDEGGTDNEEFRVAAIVDRVNTTMQVWMGTTMGCAQCHAHKYDPISMKDYYSFFAFFNQTADADIPDERPTYWHASEEERAQKKDIDARLKEANDGLKTVNAALEAADESGKADLEQQKKDFDRQKRKAESERGKLSDNINLRTPIMEELPDDQRRTTHILSRGNFLSPGKEVNEDTPEAFPPFADDQPRNRLGLANWLVSEENPLTARVTVNRYWEQFFGAGLVATSEEFGTQGAWPSHPKLLDWLAVEFMEQGWSLKELCKTIVMSATYRQRSSVTPALLERDPNNELLARGPRFRLGAEALRDQALHVSGLLSNKMYGAPVKPFQPANVWQIVYNGDTWKTSEGDDKYRRGLYTYWRRTSPYPSMMAFDATSREVCTIRRIRTNTPLQALVTLNDPVYVEAAQGMARRVLDESKGSLEKQMAYALGLALSRPAHDVEVDRLVELYAEVHETYANDSPNAELMATSLLGPAPDMEADVLAAWTVVCNTIMNLDEFLTKR